MTEFAFSLEWEKLGNEAPRPAWSPSVHACSVVGWSASVPTRRRWPDLRRRRRNRWDGEDFGVEDYGDDEEEEYDEDEEGEEEDEDEDEEEYEEEDERRGVA